MIFFNSKINMFITGKLGCGKSQFPKSELSLEQLNALKEMYDKASEQQKCTFIVSSEAPERNLIIHEEYLKRFKIFDLK